MKNPNSECKLNSCTNKTKFVNNWYGYRLTCSEECKSKDISQTMTAARKTRKAGSEWR